MYQRMKFNYTIATAENRLDLHIMWTDELCFNVIFVMWTMVVGSEVRGRIYPQNPCPTVLGMD